MRRFVYALSILVFIVLGAAFAAWTLFLRFLESPGSSSGDEKIVVIPSRASPVDVVGIFAREGLVARTDVLGLYLEHFGDKTSFRPGEYALAPTMAPIDMLKKLWDGKVVTYSVTIAPGSEAAEIVRLLGEKQLGDPKELMRLAFDPKFANELGLPSPTLEGYLFPESYEIPKNLTPQAVLGILVARYRKFLRPEVLEVARRNGLTEHGLITLASLIERSEVPPGEQKILSALLHNRLKDGEPLEVPASVEYGLERYGVTRKTASRDQLLHPWNTMVNRGLPATPIASPGISAIVAAAEPATSTARYMVERPDGTHMFCPDVDCYNTALKDFEAARPEGAPRREKRRR